MNLGTVKTGCIAAVRARTQKIAAVSSFFLPPLFLLFLEVSISVPETCALHNTRSVPSSELATETRRGTKPPSPSTHDVPLQFPASSASAGAQVLLYFKRRPRCLSWRQFLSLCLVTST